MGACTSTSRVSDEALTALPSSALHLPAHLAVEVVNKPLSNGGVLLAADVGKDKAATERVSALLPAKDGSELVGVSVMPGAADAGKGKAFTQCVRALVPAAVLPPRSGQHAYRCTSEDFLQAGLLPEVLYKNCEHNSTPWLLCMLGHQVSELRHQSTPKGSSVATTVRHSAAGCWASWRRRGRAAARTAPCG